MIYKRRQQEDRASSNTKYFTMKFLLICLLVALAEAKPKVVPKPFIPDPSGKEVRNISEYIVGGVNAGVGEIPFQASLRFVGGNSHTCGGSIITQKHILTAAHCVVNGNLFVVVGTNTLSDGGTRYDLVRQWHHENYDPNNHWRNDIALLETQQLITLGGNVQQAYLPANNVDGGNVKASGWGLSENGAGWLPNELQKLDDWPIVSTDDCKQRTGINDLYAGQICAGAQQGRGVCSGDSGGPISVDGIVLGVASFVFMPCGSGYPDVFTRVNFYNDWIFSNTGAFAHQLKYVSQVE